MDLKNLVRDAKQIRKEVELEALIFTLCFLLGRLFVGWVFEVPSILCRTSSSS